MPPFKLTFAIAAASLAFSASAGAQDWSRGDRGNGGAPLTRAQYLVDQEARFTKVDVDANGVITSAELAASIRSSEQGYRGQRGGGMRRMSRSDANVDGAITRAEFQANALQRFARMDQDGNGVVTPEERRAPGGRWRNRGAE